MRIKSTLSKTLLCLVLAAVLAPFAYLLVSYLRQPSGWERYEANKLGMELHATYACDDLHKKDYRWKTELCGTRGVKVRPWKKGAEINVYGTYTDQEKTEIVQYIKQTLPKFKHLAWVDIDFYTEFRSIRSYYSITIKKGKE